MRAIKILPLGVSGAGKSVYLASLYDRLAVKRQETCFSLRAAADVSTKLSAIYASIKDPRRPWPPGTMGGEYMDFSFDCIVDSKHGSYCLMKLAYLDFPGGLLRGDAEHSRFHQRFADTDAFLVLLDGAKIFQALKGDQETIASLEDDLSAILNPIQNHIRKPLHFVITKWDVLDGKHDLQEVADFLHRFEKFAAVIDTRKNLQRPTRLIPVSAVGPKFCTIGRDGEVKKIPNGKAKPFNVDLPISCLLFDLIGEAEKNLKEERDRSFLRRLWYRIVGNGSLFLSLSKAAIEFVPMPPGVSFIKGLLAHGLTEAVEATQRTQETLRVRYGESILEADSAQKAFEVLARYHELEMHWLKRQYPASSLGSSN